MIAKEKAIELYNKFKNTMTPKEKAKELVYEFYDIDVENMLEYGMEWQMAKKCALMCVGEVIKTISLDFIRCNNRMQTVLYWEEVKEEINKI